MIEIKDFDGEVINSFSEVDFNNYLYELRARPFGDATRPPKMNAVEMMQYIIDNHLEGAFNKTTTALYNRFGVTGAPLAMYATIICYFDLI